MHGMSLPTKHKSITKKKKHIDMNKVTKLEMFTWKKHIKTQYTESYIQKQRQKNRLHASSIEIQQSNHNWRKYQC